LLVSIPFAAWIGRLSVFQLCIVAFGAGSFRVIEGVADRAYLPSILRKEQLLAANSKLWFSYSLSQATGPGVAGALVSLLTAPFVIVIDAFSYFVAGATIASIRYREPTPAAMNRGRTLAGIRLGLVQVVRHPVLRALVLCGGMHNICSTMIVTVYFLYLARDLAIEPYVLGAILIAGGLGSMLGSVVAARAVMIFGTVTALIIVQISTGIARLLIPLASGSQAVVIAFLIGSEFLLGWSRSVFNITQISLRQTIVPVESMGRVNASIGFLLWAFTPLGALAAGVLGGWIGIHETLWLAGTGVLLATGWLVPAKGVAISSPTQERKPTRDRSHDPSSQAN
jgi:hypothetical protein